MYDPVMAIDRRTSCPTFRYWVTLGINLEIAIHSNRVTRLAH
jgi:hypothetical protein